MERGNGKRKYKKYLLYDHDSKIPVRTQNYWKLRKLEKMNESRNPGREENESLDFNQKREITSFQDDSQTLCCESASSSRGLTPQDEDYDANEDEIQDEDDDEDANEKEIQFKDKDEYDNEEANEDEIQDVGHEELANEDEIQYEDEDEDEATNGTFDHWATSGGDLETESETHKHLLESPDRNSSSSCDSMSKDSEEGAMTNSQNQNEISLQESTDENEESSTSQMHGFSVEELKKFVLLNAVKIRHNLNFASVGDFVKLFNMVTESQSFNASKYHLNKILTKFASYTTVYYICDECDNCIGLKTNTADHFDSNNSSGKLTCTVCRNIIDVQYNSNSSFFLYLSLSSQLQQLFSRFGDSILYSKNRNKMNQYSFEDIYDGQAYKKDNGEDMISLNFSYDGVPVFKSTTFSLHPVIFTINELAPKYRNKYVLLSSIWFGKSKPKVNTYFVPFVEESKCLYSDGFNYKYNGKNYNKKCRILAGVCDSVARCDVRCTSQFNGEYGCGLCKHRGERVEKGRGTVRVYPVSDDDNAFGEGLRTHEETVNYNNADPKGVKGRSILCVVPKYNIISNLPPDWMHCVALSVCRQLANLWFDPANSSNEFYFGRDVARIDATLLSFKPPLEISRTPKSVTDRKHWKAHEWATWLLYYSLPILRQVFPLKYVEHWALLVDGISILLKKSILRSDIFNAERCLLKFAKDIEIVYGKCHVSFNIHLLTHLSQSVLMWGPLWTHSAFIYEDYYQEMLKFVKSSQNVAWQVCNSFRLRCVVSYVYDSCYDYFSEKEHCFIKEMIMRKTWQNSTVCSNDVQKLGEPTLKQLSRTHYICFQRINVNLNSNSVYQYYFKIMIRKEIIHSKTYSKVLKRNSYTVLLENNDLFEIEIFIIIPEINEELCYAIGRYFTKRSKPLLTGRNLSYMNIFESKDNDLSAIPVNDIKEKVIVLPLHLDKYKLFIACTYPNRYERLV